MPERAFALGGSEMAVCRRCFGIYSGIFAGSLLAPVLRAHARAVKQRAAYLFFIAIVPMTVDWGLTMLGLWTNTPASQFGTGFLFGSLAGFYLALVVSGQAGRPDTP
ncbi:MAG: DUF2085 domain-containing protein [Bacteroidota bacterium]